MILLDVGRVSDSCGFTVPKMALLQERDVLDFLVRPRPGKLDKYRDTRDAKSLDVFRRSLPGSAKTQLCYGTVSWPDGVPARNAMLDVYPQGYGRLPFAFEAGGAYKVGAPQ